MTDAYANPRREPAGEPRPVDLRRGLRQLSRGLVAYGVIGIVVAAIAFGALVWVNGRIGGLRTEVTTTIGQIAVTTGHTATALTDASDDRRRRSAPRSDRPRTRCRRCRTGSMACRTASTSLEATLRSVNILGASPLGGAANSVAKIVGRASTASTPSWLSCRPP